MTDRALEAIVFDLDGVLIDSEQIWEEARRAVVAEYGRPYPPETTRAVMGMSAPEWARYLRATLGVPRSEDEINAAVVERVLAAFRRGLPLLDGAVACVRALQRRYRLGVASSSNRVVIELALELAGIADAFAVVVSSEEVARGKPAPDVYMRAAELLRVAPERCAAIEDSTNGIRSAHAAGMYVVAIPNVHFPPAPEALALADTVIETLRSVPAAIGARLGTTSDLPE